MWFRNLQVFRIAAGLPATAAELSATLTGLTFQPCSAQDLSSAGWIAPRAGGELVHAVGGHWLLALRREQKLLPGSVVREEAEERARQIEAEMGVRPGRKRMLELREQVMQELLPRAFSRRATTWLWCDPRGGWLGIDASSRARAEDALELLVKAVDGLRLAPLHTALAPAAAMARWLSGDEAPAGFTIDRDCELRLPAGEHATVRYVRHDLSGDEVRQHLANGKQPTRLALTWADRLSFVFTDTLEIKRLAFLDVLEDELQQQAGSADESFDASFALMAGEFSRLLPDLVAALGGEVDAG